MSYVIDRLPRCPCCGGRMEIMQTMVVGHTGRPIGRRFATFCRDGLGACEVIIHHELIENADQAVKATWQMVNERMAVQAGLLRGMTDIELDNL